MKNRSIFLEQLNKNIKLNNKRLSISEWKKAIGASKEIDSLYEKIKNSIELCGLPRIFVDNPIETKGEIIPYSFPLDKDE